MTIKYAFSNFDIVLITDSGVRTVNLDHPFYKEIAKALQSGREADALTYLDAKEKLSEGASAPFDRLGIDSVKVEVKDSLKEAPIVEVESVDGLKITGRLADMIKDFKKRGIPFKALTNFWKKLQKNPELVGKESLLNFLSANQVPLLPNGNFLAYKGVYRTDDPNVFEAAHDRSFTYTLGNHATLPREECTVDIHNACGPGLHVGGFDHARGYGNVMIDCEVDPADVVSVPTAEMSKLRACRVLPVRVNPDGKVYAADYIDLSKSAPVTQDIEEPQGGMAYTGTELDEEEDCVCADTKKKKSGGRSKKTTWYKLVGKKVVSQRKVLKPGPEWSDVRPVAQAPGKAVLKPIQKVKLPGAAEARTWYKKLPNGTIDRRRAVTKPAGYSSHKPH